MPIKTSWKKNEDIFFGWWRKRLFESLTGVWVLPTQADLGERKTGRKTRRGGRRRRRRRRKRRIARKRSRTSRRYGDLWSSKGIRKWSTLASEGPRGGMEKENFNHKYAEYIILHMTIMSRVYLFRRNYFERKLMKPFSAGFESWKIERQTIFPANRISKIKKRKT